MGWEEKVREGVKEKWRRREKETKRRGKVRFPKDEFCIWIWNWKQSGRSLLSTGANATMRVIFLSSSHPPPWLCAEQCRWCSVRLQTLRNPREQVCENVLHSTQSLESFKRAFLLTREPYMGAASKPLLGGWIPWSLLFSSQDEHMLMYNDLNTNVYPQACSHILLHTSMLKSAGVSCLCW